MKKFIIKWNAGDASKSQVVKSRDWYEANTMAYYKWRGDVEKKSIYSATEYTPELAKDLGLE